jgi:hypothetical protein
LRGEVLKKDDMRMVSGKNKIWVGRLQEMGGLSVFVGDEEWAVDDGEDDGEDDEEKERAATYCRRKHGGGRERRDGWRTVSC